MPPSPSTSSTPGHEPGVATVDGDPTVRAAHDDGAGAHDAGAEGAGERDGGDESGDARAGVGVGGADSDGADDGDRFADAYDESGRVASRPGYPAEPAARSRPFGRVSLAPPLAPLAALTAGAGTAPWRQGSIASPAGPPSGLLASALRAALVGDLASLALAGCAGCGHRLGSSPQHSVPRRCRLRLAPAPALRRARNAAPVSPLVRALLRSATRTSLRTAPCSAARTRAGTVASASGSVLRTAACGSGRTPRPLTRRGGFDEPRSPAPIPPSLMPRDGRSRPPGGGLGSHTRRIVDAGCAMAARARDIVR